MRLLATTHVPHWVINGTLMSSGYFIRDLRIFGDLFDEVCICAPKSKELPPDDAVSYGDGYTLVDCSVARGADLRSRLRRSWAMPIIIARIMRAMRGCDAIHIRGPEFMGIFGAIAVLFTNKPRCAKFANQWTPRSDEPLANKIQRWLFSRPGFGGPVTVNAIWGGNRRHIYSVFNSSITRSQLEKTREIAQSKRLGNPTRFLYVGRIDSNKNLDVILRAFAKARAEAGKEMRLDIVGNGPDLPAIKVLADDLGLSGSSFFHGHKSPNAVCKIYAGSHILLLASSAEGWPKTPMEAMCHGVPSICSNVSTLPMILGNEERGLLVEPRDVQGLASAMKRLATNNELYVRMSRAGRKWVENKTREDLMIQIKSILEGAWGIELRTPI